MVHYLRLLIFFVCLLGPLMVGAQSSPRTNPPVCGTPDLPLEQHQQLTQQALLALRIKQASTAAPTGITYIPIRPHIFRKSDGSGGMPLAKMNNIIAITNSYYLFNGSGIQFYFAGTSPDYIDNDTLYNSFPVGNESSANGRDALNAMNQYYVNAFSQSGLGGYAYFPSNAVQSTRSFILNESDEVDLGNRLLPHELGHNFGLFHTFGNTGSGTTELVTRGLGANCTTDGDELCDTPADPYGMAGATTTYVNSCQTYTGTAVDAQGNPYAPSITNIMSYYFPCTHDFTPGQYDRMQAGLALRQTHTAYSLNYPPTVVAAPTNVSALISAGTVVLSWQDNSTNEMGYFIERSTASNSGFIPIGGVGTSNTTFTDTKIAALTTYYYRVRPSNATTQGISQVVSITTPTCHPYYPYACTDNDGLNSLTINNNSLSQNSGCSPNGYSVSTAISTTILSGKSVPVTGKLLSTVYKEGVTVWADLNRNGSFDADRNELLYQTPTTLTTQFSGSLTFPGSLSAGPLSIRVVVAYNTIPLDPCGTYSYGETEDYVVYIAPAFVAPAPSADLSLSVQSSNRIQTANQPFSYSVTIRNDGPNDATGISWQNRLPPNISFVSGDSSLMNSGTAVSGTNLSLVSGTSATFVYQVKATQPGTFLNSAQILTSNQPDPDSQPGSGTGDGQDDAATVDIRIMPSSPVSSDSLSYVVYASPNPNQTPLPTVLSNQPAPNPTKADLSLTMQISTRVPLNGQPVMFTISVANAGGLSSTSIVVRDTLWGLMFTTSPTGMSVVGSGTGYTIVEGRLSTLAAGAAAQLLFTATPATSGYLVNTAQIWSAVTPDPDSTPGSVTPTANNLNGEDDVASVDMRVGFF